MRFAPLILCFVTATAARAQVPVTAATDARQRPGGPVLASLPPGAAVLPAGVTSGGEALVTVEGWVDAARLGAARDSFPASVSGRITLRVRARPASNGDVVATLQPGTGVHVVSRQGTWARVRRALWIPSSALPAPVAGGAPAGRAPAPGRASQSAGGTPTPPGTGASAPNAQNDSRGTVAPAGTRVHDLPSGTSVGGLVPGTSVEIVARQPGWVRVRLDGWVPEGDVLTGAAAAAPAVRAADLRADPAGMKGRVVRWDVEVMALQRADPLRPELALDEPYLLARGPGTENVVLYLAVPPNLLAEARSIPPLTRVTVTARVRSGRSEPAGTPILDLLTIERR